MAGQSDIARALNVSRQRVGQLRQLHGFPQPVQTVNGAPVWVLGEVLDWHARRRVEVERVGAVCKDCGRTEGVQDGRCPECWADPLD